MEWWALPRMADEFSEWGIPQYWDDERRLSLEIKERLVPQVEEEIPWDMFILFGPEATWAEAENHVLGWGAPVIQETEEFEALLLAIPAREPVQTTKASERGVLVTDEQHTAKR